MIGLEDGDRRPKRVRRPQWSPELAEAVLRLREARPGMGKEKLWKLLDREGMAYIHLHGGADLEATESARGAQRAA